MPRTDPVASTVPPAPSTPSAPPALPDLRTQAERLIELGVHEIAGLTPTEVRAFAESAMSAGSAKSGESAASSEGAVVSDSGGGVLLAVHPDRARASALAPLLLREGKPGFVVTDMPDVDLFAPLDTLAPPATALYLVTGLDRGDRMANWSPDEALPALTEQGRTPLLLTEGIQWVLHQPAVLERNRCFMTIGSRLRKPRGALDARTPAIWISNGTGRDGRERRNAPKVGWCWAGNRHTWLGFASASGRHAPLGSAARTP